MLRQERLVPRTVHVHVAVDDTLYVVPMDGYYDPATDDEIVRPDRDKELRKIVRRLGGKITERPRARGS